MHPYDQIIMVGKIGLIAMGAIYFSKFFIMVWAFVMMEVLPNL